MINATVATAKNPTLSLSANVRRSRLELLQTLLDAGNTADSTLIG